MHDRAHPVTNCEIPRDYKQNTTNARRHHDAEKRTIRALRVCAVSCAHVCHTSSARLDDGWPLERTATTHLFSCTIYDRAVRDRHHLNIHVPDSAMQRAHLNVLIRFQVSAAHSDHTEHCTLVCPMIYDRHKRVPLRSKEKRNALNHANAN